MSAKLDEVPVVHLEHSHPEFTLCGKLNTRLTPISTNNTTDCVACIVHAQEGTEAEVPRED